MQALQTSLISFFVQTAKRDNYFISKIAKEKSFTIKHQYWYFTLPALHIFLKRQNEISDSISYTSFRKCIYLCPINKSIKKYGANIIIADNKTNVDQSNYALVWREQENDST